MLIGVDEVGRGCWAGPLVAAAVILDEPIYGLTDSKKLTKQRREELAAEVELKCRVGIGWVTAVEVDELGLTAATSKAMKIAVDQVHVDGALITIDGNLNLLPGYDNVTCLVKADLLIPEVSAASIVAKVARDNFMAQQAIKFPNYQFEKHVGYGTKLHKEMLLLHGICDLHRKSYKPIQELVV